MNVLGPRGESKIQSPSSIACPERRGTDCVLDSVTVKKMPSFPLPFDVCEISKI